MNNTSPHELNKFQLNLQVIILCCCIILLNMGQGLILPIIGPLFLDVHNGLLPQNAPLSARYFYYSAMLFSFSLGLLISSPIWGDLADKFGRKKMFLLGLYGTFFCFGFSAISIQMQWLWATLFARFFSAFFIESTIIITVILIDLGGQQRKAQLLRFNRMSIGIGMLLGPLAAGLWIKEQSGFITSYARPFAYMSAIVLIALLLLQLFLVKDQKSPSTPLIRSDGYFKALGALFKIKTMWRLNISLFFFGVAWFTLFQYLPFFLPKDMLYKPMDTASFMIVMAIIYQLVLLLVYPVLVRYFDSYRIISTGLWFGGIIFILLALSRSESMLWVCCALLISLVAVIEMGFLVHYSDTISQEHQGLGMGMNSSVMSLSALITSITTGFLAFLDSQLPFYVCAIAMALSFLFRPGKTTFHSKE